MSMPTIPEFTGALRLMYYFFVQVAKTPEQSSALDYAMRVLNSADKCAGAAGFIDKFHPFNAGDACPICGSSNRAERYLSFGGPCNNVWHDFGDGETLEHALARRAFTEASRMLQPARDGVHFNFSIDGFEKALSEVLHDPKWENKP
jgi:hypothetical protein